MPNSRNIINALVNHFESNGWPYDMDEEKLRNRSCILVDDSEQGYTIVGIKRHRAIFGTKYIKGQPMPNHEAYFMRYAINLATLQVKELSDKTVEHVVDMASVVLEYFDNGIVELYIDKVDEIHYRISERVGKTEIIVTTLEEAEPFILELVNVFVNWFSEDGLILIDNPKMMAEYLSDFKVCIKQALLSKIENLWNDRNI